MLVNMKCPNCAATLQFDDSKESMSCPYCGGEVVNIAEKININQQVNVSGTVVHVQDRSNDPNLYISYNTNNPGVGMVTRIVSTGVKNTYVNGQTLSFHLVQGQQTVVLKIGKKNYSRDIIIPSDNSPVRIYASFNGRAQITVDQPNVTTELPTNTQVIQTSSVVMPSDTGVQPIVSAEPVAGDQVIQEQSIPQQVNSAQANISQTPAKAKSPLSILAFVLSLTVYLSWAGAGLGAVEIFVLDKEKVKNHIFSYLAIGIGAILTVGLIFGLGNGSLRNSSNRTTQPTYGVVTEREIETATTTEVTTVATIEETTSTATEETTTETTVATPTPTPVPTNTPTPTPKPTPVETTVNYAYDSLSEYAEVIEDTLEEGFADTNATFTVSVDEDQNQIMVYLTQPGACAVAMAAAAGDSDSILAWDDFDDSFKSLSSAMYESVIANVDVKNPTVGIVLLNDQNTDNVLLAYANGMKIYDVTEA